MAKKYKKSNKCPEPLNTMIDLAGAAALSALVKSKVKRDYQKGIGEESARAAAFVFGIGSLRRGGEGLVNLGGLVGLNSALNDIQRQGIPRSPMKTTPKRQSNSAPAPKDIWRDHCEDGSDFGIYPQDYDSPDDYMEALREAREQDYPEVEHDVETVDEAPETKAQQDANTKNIWRKYCTDGSPYGLDPKDFETADDYEDAIQQMKQSENDHD